ncbi:hypothetical protein RvY_02924 [Ramazzottius varieornatus]|uniref:G-protein coupled receptors family 1 profile domain-containing protein n=1 Tax=Ramazzottius varieornatus TaxID=947166 RepID=A0A1D1UWH1_RAMVA|nr:hypothetical protein RvY_02924 [Ramazzottius varieornatus]
MLTNGSVLYLFICEPSLITPSTAYAINLFIANLMTGVIPYPFKLFSQVYSTWWIGEVSCTMEQYTDYIFSGGLAMWQHLNICVVPTIVINALYRDPG